MAVLEFELNGRQQRLEVEPDTPLLWVIREQLGLSGTKFGCGMSLCGACTVHLDGNAIRSCTYPVALVQGKQVTTIEGLGSEGEELHPVQQAWVEFNVPQCGYCQSGQIMSAAALLAVNPAPSEAEIDTAMAGNICRCGTYPRIRRAVQRAAELTAQRATEAVVQYHEPQAGGRA